MRTSRKGMERTEVPDMERSKLERLPPWAREHVAALEGKVREAEAKLEAHLRGDAPKDSRVTLRRYVFTKEGNRQVVVPLPEDANVFFALSGGAVMSVALDRHHGECLKVALVDGPGTFAVCPVVANVVHVRVLE